MGASVAGSSTPSSGKRRRAAPRPQKKKKSPAMEVVKVFLGGIAGLVIAQAILWWLPWTKYRRDPFELGPKVSEFAGWMVPEQFHGKGGTKPAEAGEAGPAAQNSDSLLQPSEDEPAGAPGTGMPQRTFVDPNKTQDDSQQSQTAGNGARNKGNRSKKQTETREEPASASVADVPPPSIDDTDLAGLDVDPLGDLDLDLDTDLLDMIDPSEDPIIDEPTLEEPGSETPSDGIAGNAMGETSPAARIANAPAVSDAELRTALDEANAVAQAWLAAEDANDRQLVFQGYQALAKLAEAVTFADDMGNEQRQSVSDLLAPLLSDSARLGSLKMVGQRWSTFNGRDGSGILLVGTVVETKPEGDLFVTKLQVGDNGDVLAVYQGTAPAADSQPGASMVVLGAIVDDPEDSVAGYAGDAATLIWVGQSQVLAGN
jgi:hypothetical protein